MDLVYLIGAPGVGKSSVMAALTAGAGRYAVKSRPAHDVLFTSHGGGARVVGAEIGVRRDAFSGTDGLPLNIQHYAEEWVRNGPFPLVVGEGQRLANVGFLSAARDGGYRVCLVVLDAPAEVAAERRERRGSNQNPAWVKGAETRVTRLADAAAAAGFGVHVVDAVTDVGAVVGHVREVAPVLGVLC